MDDMKELLELRAFDGISDGDVAVLEVAVLVLLVRLS